jgi:hypothetical protein
MTYSVTAKMVWVMQEVSTAMTPMMLIDVEQHALMAAVLATVMTSLTQASHHAGRGQESVRGRQ